MKPAISKRYPETARYSGFTLIEIVVGIVVSAIALTLLSVLFFSNAGRSVEPILQIRAAEFGQALLDEILAKKFDQKTPVGGVPACNPCTPPANFGPDASESRATFNDVDDYNTYCGGSDLIDAFGTDLSVAGGPFQNFTMSVCVIYDSNYDGVGDGAGSQVGATAKLITVKIYPPGGAGLGGAPITFSAYRGNY